MSEWKEKTLGELSIRVSSGLTPLKSNKEFWENPIIPWLKTDQLGEKYIFDTNTKISKEALEQTSLRIYPENTISIAMYGEGKTRGNLSIIKAPMTTNQACCNIELDTKLADVEYVYYYLKTQYDALRKLSSGVRKNLNSNDIKNYKIYIPESVSFQKSIVRILTSLDNKISVNNQINQELEAMAKALYDYWFVQFDFPDQNGKPYKSSGGKMVYNPELKREIPEGWGNSILGEFADLYQPKTISDKDMIEDGEYLVYGANGIIGRYSEYNHEDSMVTISCRGNCGIINITRPYSWITGNSMVVKPKDDIYNIDYISNLLLSLSISSVITGSVQKQLTRTSLVPLKVIIPNKEIIEKYRSITKASFEKRKSIQIEVEQLTQLRDWLLPMLMNGQVKVK